MSEIKTDSVVNVSGDNDSGIDLSTNDVVAIKTANSERVRVDASGNVGIGATTVDAKLHVEVSSGDANLKLEDGSAVSMLLDQNSIGGSSNIRFKTGGSLTEQARVENNAILFFKTATGKTVSGIGFENHGSNNVSCHMTAANDPILILNRQSADGTLVQFRHADNTEGSIVSSGSTVSYNGGHLSRWSRLLDGSRPDTLLKGTVLSNLDDMIVWTGEENDQLNHTKISDTEGDVNAAGVFVAWDDDDDDYEDFYLAMTGDFVIRIASGTTVARGDLLMSAGDGTAKPQGDDIVRSKTIAKVTSTTKSHTYDDGSFLVPCVLMAC